MLEITEPAKEYLRDIVKDSPRDYVSFGVKGGGCSGFSYIWDFSDGPLKADEIVDIGEGKSLIVDGTSIMYTLGSKIDYVKELGGTYLKVDNPLVSSQCGCGESFNIKM
jgi:iron-sulfur cluster assembly accessory protein